MIQTFHLLVKANLIFSYIYICILYILNIYVVVVLLLLFQLSSFAHVFNLRVGAIGGGTPDRFVSISIQLNERILIKFCGRFP